MQKKKNVHTVFEKITYMLSLLAFKIDYYLGLFLIQVSKISPRCTALPTCPMARVTWGANSLAPGWGREVCFHERSELFLKPGKLGKYYSNPTCKFQDVSPPCESTNFGLKYFWPMQLPNH